MPEIQRQTPIQPAKVNDPLARIQSVVKMAHNRLTLCCYGQPKTGKTRLAATFPKPVFIIGTDRLGTESISNVEGVDFVLIESTSEVKFFTNVAIKRGVKTLVLDNASQLQQLVLSEMVGLDSIPVQQQRGIMAKVDNQEYSFKTKSALDELFRFQGHIVFLAHERNFTEGQQSELLTPHIASSLSKGVADWLNGTCSHICQTFIREKKVIREDLVEGEKTEVGTGLGEYCLRVGPHPIYKAGLRVPVGVIPPNVIMNPTYDKIASIIKGTYKLQEGEY